MFWSSFIPWYEGLKTVHNLRTNIEVTSLFCWQNVKKLTGNITKKTKSLCAQQTSIFVVEKEFRCFYLLSISIEFRTILFRNKIKMWKNSIQTNILQQLQSNFWNSIFWSLQCETCFRHKNAKVVFEWKHFGLISQCICCCIFSCKIIEHIQILGFDSFIFLQK